MEIALGQACRLVHRLHRGVAVADLAIDARRCLDQLFPPRQPPLLGGMPAVMSLSCRFRHLNLLDKPHCQMPNSDNSACQKENIATSALDQKSDQGGCRMPKQAREQVFARGAELGARPGGATSTATNVTAF